MPGIRKRIPRNHYRCKCGALCGDHPTFETHQMFCPDARRALIVIDGHGGRGGVMPSGIRKRDPNTTRSEDAD